MMKFYAFLLCLILIKQVHSLNCPAGSYFGAFGGNCYICPTGSFCPGDNSKVQCKSGYYANKSGSTSCKICPVAHSCSYTHSTPAKCGTGLYQDQAGQTYCKWCNDGEYSTETGRSTKCDVCPVGHSCKVKNRAPVLCGIGLYQDQTGQRYCKWCKDGEYNTETGRSTKCDVCPLGHSCKFRNWAPIRCGKGSYQNETRQTSCKPCRRGEYNTQSGRSTKCDVCPVGHSCYFKYRAPVICGKGQYQDQTGQRYCKSCKDGEYNTETGRSTKCDICPVGHRCYFRHRAPVKCGKGHYQDQTGQRYCKPCMRGEYNNQTGRSTKCDVCPVGHRCYFRFLAPTKCGKRRYQDQSGQVRCKWCKSGQYNLQTGATICKSCPAGSRCPFASAKPIPCGKGEYSPAESVKCLPCPPGSFCPSPSMLPVPPNNDTLLKRKIHNTAKYAAEAYQDKTDSSSNGRRLIGSDNKVHGFVKYEENAIIVSFRGTVDNKDRKTNAKISKLHHQSCANCKVHAGFSSYYNSLQMQVLAKVSALSRAHPNSKVIVTGHSLGGALATLAAVELEKAGYNTDLITYGSPRVGNKQFSEYVDKTLTGLNLRVTYKNDIVTALPPQWTGYRHAGQEMHYTDASTSFILPPKIDVGYFRARGKHHGIELYKKLN